jgi:hypothetical protein
MVAPCGDTVGDAAFASDDYACRTANGDYSFFIISGSPSPAQIKKICGISACQEEITAIRKAQPTECVVHNKLQLYRDILDPITAGCKGKNASASEAPSLSSQSPVNPPTTTSSAMALRTEVPVASQIKSSRESNMGMMGGIGGGVVVVALLIGFFVFRSRRNANSTTRCQRESDGNRTHPGKTDGGQVALSYADMTTPIYSSQSGNTHREQKQQQHRFSTGPTSTQSSSQGTLSTYSTNSATHPLWNDLDLDRVRIGVEDIHINETAVLGRGGFCEVLVARYDGQEVAVKRLLPALRDDEAMQAMLLAEAKTMTTLNHRQIVRLVGVAWHEPHDLCIVTELVRGTDMSKYIAHAKEHHSPPGFNTEKVLMALQIADALDYLHRQSRPVLHRDIKPANVLVTDNYQAKLIDFGVSRDNDATLKTSQIGTKYWMAPEQALSKRYDAKVDIFAFGVLLSELDTYEAPYSQSLDGRSMTDAVFYDSVRSGRLTVTFSGDENDPVAQLGRECVQVHPRDRPTASDLFRRLQEILHEFQKRDDMKRALETVY